MITSIPYLRNDSLAPGDHRRRLWDSLPCDLFIDLSLMETFRTGHTSVLVKIRPSFPSIPLDRRSVGELPFGRLRLITCADLPIAYTFDAPKCTTVVGRNYATVLLRGQPPQDFRRVFVDGYLIVVGDDTGLTLTIPQKRWIQG